MALFSTACDKSRETQQEINLQKNELGCEKCNFLLLNIELLRADYVGLINPDQESVTPNIDLFFRNALRFNNATAPAGESYRSNLSVLTAKNSFNYRHSQIEIDRYIKSRIRKTVVSSKDELSLSLQRFDTITQRFQENGYHTISLNQGIRAGSHLHLDRGFDYNRNWNSKSILLNQLVDELKEQLELTKQPFFMLFRPETLHPFPYYYPDSNKITAVSEYIDYRHKPGKQLYAVRYRPGLENSKKKLLHQMIYRQQLRYVDDQLRSVFDLLESNDFLNNTVVVLYSNHGSGLGDNNIDRLAVSYQSCVHVPLIIRHPNIAKPVLITEPVPLIDLAPTLLQMAALPKLFEADGRSLLRKYPSSGAAISPIAGRNDVDEFIRERDMKLIIKNGEYRELYDLSTDPGELNNIVEQQKQIANNLEQKLIKLKILAD